jgi:DNA-binding response OmpR family regulator
VLLVEDEAGLRDMLCRTLQRAGFTVFVAANGRAALTMLRARPVDIVITDILMPEMDGFELIRLVSAQWPDVPIVAMSGIHDDVKFSRLARKCGAREALSKPIDRSQLIQLVRSVTQSAVGD